MVISKRHEDTVCMVCRINGWDGKGGFKAAIQWAKDNHRTITLYSGSIKYEILKQEEISNEHSVNQ